MTPSNRVRWTEGRVVHAVLLTGLLTGSHLLAFVLGSVNG